jgi:DNA-directed RNA polymerase specialized sigma24 family protein
MGETSKSRLKRDWAPDESVFHKFLQWLDGGRDSNGERYLEMRRRLVGYFDRKQCGPADDLADETLNRVARRLEEEGSITESAPAQYCYIVAKFVFLEHLRRTRHQITTGEADFDLLAFKSEAARPVAQSETAQTLLECLEGCLERLFPTDRNLILEYYRGEQGEKIENRRKLAERLALTMNALSIRACRIRDRLEACVMKSFQES